ncbi:MAG: pyridoxamine 5'-phosphate oxidase family protein [Pseudomonadota bacterium]
MTNPINPTDDEARSLARRLIDDAKFGAIGVLDPQTGRPIVSRIAVATMDDGTPMTLISDLSNHTKALRADPVASLLVGEPGPKGDPLTHPRLTLHARAEFLERSDALRERYLSQHPKAALYIDFGDFSFVRLAVDGASLNGGFGKAYELTATDLAGPESRS